jgi:hypothetical protein
VGSPVPVPNKTNLPKTACGVYIRIELGRSAALSISQITRSTTLPLHSQTADREQIRRAREAAEALFRPVQQAPREDVPAMLPGAAPSSHGQAPRRPRILAASSTEPMRDPQPEAPVTYRSRNSRPERQSIGTRRPRVRAIPASEHGRIRTLVTYGMTAEQVATLYEVRVAEIERIAANASV